MFMHHETVYNKMEACALCAGDNRVDARDADSRQIQVRSLHIRTLASRSWPGCTPASLRHAACMGLAVPAHACAHDGLHGGDSGWS